MLDTLIDHIRAARSAGRVLSIRGGGSKDFYGAPRAAETLSTQALSGIVSYEPSELVLTAQGGTPLAEVEAALAAHRQFLPFEPPFAGQGATLGGVVAAGLSGPRRPKAGAVRDFVLGIRLVDGRGELLRFGGQVMKNVAGYDVARAVTGSLGTLGVITEVSLKVLPLPAHEVSQMRVIERDAALATMQAWNARPWPITAAAYLEDTLYWRLSGADGALEAAGRALGGTALPDDAARRLWQSLRDQTHDFFASHTGCLWRLALPPATPALAVPAGGAEVIEWAGSLRWWRVAADAEVGAQVRALARAAGGHATLYRGPDDLKRALGVFTPRAAALSAIEERVRRAFDPDGVFDARRLYEAPATLEHA